MEQLNVHNLMHCHKKYFSVHLFCWIAAFPPYSLFFEKSETTLELRRFAEKELKRNLEKILLQFELRQATMASCSFKVHLEQNLQWVLSSKLVRLQPAWSPSFNRVNHHYWVKSNGNGNHDFILWIKMFVLSNFCFDLIFVEICIVSLLLSIKMKNLKHFYVEWLGIWGDLKFTKMMLSKFWPIPHFRFKYFQNRLTWSVHICRKSLRSNSQCPTQQLPWLILSLMAPEGSRLLFLKMLRTGPGCAG